MCVDDHGWNISVEIGRDMIYELYYRMIEKYKIYKVLMIIKIKKDTEFLKISVI